MQKVLLVLIGGATGTGFRFGLATLINALIKQPSFPYATFLINLTGSFAIGLLAEWFYAKEVVSPDVRVAILTGVLGGYTTFSSFSIETFGLLRDGKVSAALMYALGSVVLGLLATWGGVRLGQNF